MNRHKIGYQQNEPKEATIFHNFINTENPYATAMSRSYQPIHNPYYY
jgi:hypothetical protein